MNTSGIATAFSFERRSRRASRTLALLLSGALALGASVLVSTAAHADDLEIQPVEYVYNEAGDTTTIDAAILTDNPGPDGQVFTAADGADGWFACIGPLSTDTIGFVGENNVIIADGCEWDSNEIDAKPGAVRSLTFWGGPMNSGTLRAVSTTGFSGIGNIADNVTQVAAALIFNGGSIKANATPASAGVGGAFGNNSGTITVQWRASIEASGGAPGGAGIGSGASTGTTTRFADTITINTTGLVRAVAGGAQGTYKAGADIGTGGPNGGANTAISQVETVTVPAATVGSNGSVEMFSAQQSLLPVAAVDHAAVGSALTYKVTPATGYRVATNPGTTKVGTDLYRHSITSTTPSTAIGFTFEEIPAATLSLSAAPTTGQTRPGDVTLSATASDSTGPLSGKPVVFTVNGNPVPAVLTDSSGVATYTLTSPAVGSYSFAASFTDASGTISATPITGYTVARANQTVTLNGVPATATYGDGPVTLSLNKQGTGTISYSTDNSSVAALNGDTLSFAKAGTAQITGAITQDDTYAAASTSKTVLVSEATPTVALTYSGGTSTATPVALTATVTVPAGASQPVAGSSVQFYDGATAIGSPVALSTSGVANYEISSPARGAHSYTARYAGITDYYAAATSNSVALSIAGVAQSALAITQPSSAATVYGAAPFSLTLTGQLNTTTPIWSVPNNDAFTISSDGEITVTGAGSATVTVTVPADGIYDESTVTLTITIAKRQVRVTASDLSMAFGDPTPEFEYQIDSGLLEGDSLGGSLKLASGLRAGANDIVEDEPFANPNYQVTFVPGTLTVTANEAQQSVIDTVELLTLPITNWDDADQVVVATLAYEALDEESKSMIPVAVVETLTTAQEQAGEVNHRNSENGVTAESADLSWGIRLVTDPAGPDTPEHAALSTLISAERSVIGLYDIHFINTLTGERWQPEVGSPVSIELSKVIVSGYTQIGVTHQLADGTIESIPSTLDGNIIRFEGPSFSMYGVTGIKVTSDDSSPVNPPADSPAASAAALSNTGGAEPFGVALAALMLLGAGALLVAPRLRRS